ncbi:transposase, partial [Heyndrickxia sporothermodurans]|uniref:Transposase n=1 Tax=Heyndrickxia sporothermodurans TaxID=46224 RepID=A0AB37H6J4_9BACI|nr:transposase [Heyndrickxia sporothermodurans]MBL5768334.1 transposase [Heyndrickxia sporothermodurans]MBL5771991.1 transposase [Heyndrickxia sporothermodurans]MBL5775599.1 transposase [Heyndrickxia sporothermodurans]MBL5777480.1 transposase [Heyndrickxia sporothermodurans]MBL5781107.1 transposase [Heyndrickxia sporothermodurans]
MKRTKHSKDFKLQVVKEATETGNNSLVARRYELNPNMVSRWIREYKDGKYGEVDVTVLPDIDSKELSEENEKLKIILGEKDLEIAILRDLIKKKNPHLLKNLK